MKHFIVALIIFFWGCPLWAAELVVSAPQEVKLGQPFIVEFIVDSDDTAINAVEGVVNIPSTLNVVDINIDGSVVTYWVDKPSVSSEGQIKFAGVVPGGFKGDHHVLFKGVFRADTESDLEFAFNNARVLAHDGLGNELPVSYRSAVVAVSETAPDFVMPVISDITGPEEFIVRYVNESHLADNSGSIIFHARDGESGLDRVELTLDGENFSPVTSPYVVDSNDGGEIILRAYDKLGNFTEQKIIVDKNSPHFNLFEMVFWGAGVILVLIIGLLWLKRN